MREYTGIASFSLPDPKAPDFTPRLRNMLGTLDAWARDASFGFARINAGETPSGSGSALASDPPDLTPYFYLPGRSGGQLGYAAAVNEAALSLIGYTGSTSPVFAIGQTGLSTEVRMYGNSTVRSYSSATVYSEMHATTGVQAVSGSLSSVMTSSGFTYNTSAVQVTLNSTSLSHTDSVGATNFSIKGDNGVTLQDTSAVMSLASNATTKQWLLKTTSATATDPLFLVQQENGGTGDIQQWLNSSSGVLARITAAGVYSGAADVADNAFTVHDNGDTSKKVALECSSITAATTRTLTVADADGTIATQDWLGTGTAAISVADLIIPDASSGGGVSIHLTDPGSGFDTRLVVAALTGAREVTFPNASGTIVIDSSSTLYFLSLSTSSVLKSTSSSVGCCFSDSSTSTKKLRMVLSGAVGNNSFTFTNTAARNYGFGNLGGNAVVVGDNTGAAAAGLIQKLDLTAQTAAIGSTNMTSSAPAGYYVVDYTLEVTTANVADVSVQFQVNYTDDIGATNQTGGVLVLTATGRDRGSFQVYLASGELSYQTNVVTQTTSRYALRVRVTFLG